MKTRVIWALAGAFLLFGPIAQARELKSAHRATTPPVNGWLLGCKLMILNTDTVATAGQMQRELDDALRSEPCQRAVAEISLASRIRAIRDEIRKLQAFESDDLAGL
jgi:hypothetical protein